MNKDEYMPVDPQAHSLKLQLPSNNSWLTEWHKCTATPPLIVCEAVIRNAFMQGQSTKGHYSTQCHGHNSSCLQKNLRIHLQNAGINCNLISQMESDITSLLLWLLKCKQYWSKTISHSSRFFFTRIFNSSQGEWI